MNVIGFEHIKDLYEHDPSFDTPYAKCLTHTSWELYYIKDGYLMRANTLCIPESSIRLLLLQEDHGGGLIGHFGRDKTFATPYAKCVTHTSWERYYIKDGYHMRANKLCIPKSSLRLLLLQEAHGGGLMGHLTRQDFRHALQELLLAQDVSRCCPLHQPVLYMLQS